MLLFISFVLIWSQSLVDLHKKLISKSLPLSPLSKKVEELKAQLASMELPTTGLKAELAERLAEGLVRFSLSDDNFQHAEVVDTTSNDSELPNCFPQVVHAWMVVS